VDAELLLLVLPDDLAPSLSDFAAKDLAVFNHISDDLMTSTTHLALASGRTSLEVNGRTCGFNPSVGRGKFYVALVSSDRFVLSCHDLGEEGIDALLGAWQGARGSSGPNYRPYRVWTQEQLDAAARGEDVLGVQAPNGTDPCWEMAARRVALNSVYLEEVKSPAHIERKQ
jgi:hypothetical protein